MSRKKQALDAVSRSKLAREIVSKARTELILDEPFFGVLSLKLLLVEDNACDTMWTDGVHMGYNPDFVIDTPKIEVKGVVCHEVLHCAAGHPWRRGMRDPDDWNEAADYAINPIVQDAGFYLPLGVLLDPAFKGLPAEMIYDRIHKPKDPSDSQQPQPNQGGQGQSSDESPKQPGNPGEGDGEGDPQDGDSQDEGQSADKPGQGSQKGKSNKPHWGEVRDAPEGTNAKQLAQEWKLATEQAAVAAKARGKLPGSLEELVEDIKKPLIDWREVLWQFVQQAFSSPDYNWKTPNRRYMGLSLYLPALIGEQMPPVVVARDTSASMPNAMLAQIYSELKAIVEQMKPEITYAVDADAQVADVMEILPGDDFKFNAKGRGGTDFRPVFRWVEEQDIQPCCLIYLTDMDGPAPEFEPEYPVLWVTPPKARKAPWGMQIEMPL